ncbi:carboxymuconolactone decarboxylase family protein, partial [Enterobacter asburiae]|uniref:carboxymuconolactone decarboxylase family protein n=1 Tax=Enterobacter asburiae TaxID=61645 RepID=UPI003C72F0C7
RCTRVRSSAASDVYQSQALAYAEAMTATPPRADDVVRTALKRHFTDDAITEMTALIAFQNLSARFNAALDIPAQGLCATFSETPYA